MQRLHAAENGLRGLAGELLVADSFDERLEGALRTIGLEAARTGAFDDSSQRRIRSGKMLESFAMHVSCETLTGSQGGGNGNSAGGFRHIFFGCHRAVALHTPAVPHVHFTPNLARQTDAPECTVDGTTVAEALGAVFARHPKLRNYVLDDQGALRTHVIVFVDGEAMKDRQRLSDPLTPGAELYVMQALSGG